jgi:hypothetical protein
MRSEVTLKHDSYNQAVKAVVTEDATNYGKTVNLCPASSKHTLSVMKTSQLMTDIGTTATISVIHIPHKTQKFTLWVECRIFLMLQLLAQLSNH